MPRKLAETVLRFALVGGCGGIPPAVQSSAAGPSQLGGPCTVRRECQSDLYCEKDGSGGQCLKKCASSADCGAGAVCNDEKKCYRACQRNSDCGRRDYVCAGASPNKFCQAFGEDEVQQAIDQGQRYGK